MIKIEINKDTIKLKGHANYSEHGTDIVCSGVSSLVETFKLNLPNNHIENEEETIIYDSGDTEMEVYMLQFVKIGLIAIGKTYPNNIKVIHI